MNIRRLISPWFLIENPALANPAPMRPSTSGSLKTVSLVLDSWRS
jgi:hypothetical protein